MQKSESRSVVSIPDLVRAIELAAFARGLLLLSCGVSTLRFIPPLSVSRAQVDEALMLFEAALTEALAEK